MTTRIRCRDHRCAFNKRGICTTDEIEYDPDAGCLTMEVRVEVEDVEEKELDDEEMEEELEEELEDEEDDDEEDWNEEGAGWSGPKKAKRRT
ncbi:MAG: hypothetical protein HY327_13120 [Chloroflexi bacterium]|nr:hypothetical protein [Chloroflexota bacterium]